MSDGWRRDILTESRRKMLKTMLTQTEWDALALSRASEVSYGTVYQSLKAFGDLRWATSRLEGQAEHHNRKKKGNEVHRGRRLTYWQLTPAGLDLARSL